MIVGDTINHSTDSFTMEESPRLPEFRGNYHQVEQVVINLLTNACQALPGRRSAITVSTHYDESGVVLAVSDEGKGIPQELIPRIADPFFTTRREKGGSGLGLAVSSRIVQNHGGSMSFRSRVGQGTVVTVRFPAVETAA
jgi:signal transduction histidine kinase